MGQHGVIDRPGKGPRPRSQVPTDLEFVLQEIFLVGKFAVHPKQTLLIERERLDLVHVR